MTDEGKEGMKELGLASAPVESFNVTDEKLAIRQVDAALQFLRAEGDHASIGEVDEKKLVWKIDRLMMPLMFGVYVLQYIDKSLSMY